MGFYIMPGNIRDAFWAAEEFRVYLEGESELKYFPDSGLSRILKIMLGWIYTDFTWIIPECGGIPIGEVIA